MNESAFSASDVDAHHTAVPSPERLRQAWHAAVVDGAVKYGSSGQQALLERGIGRFLIRRVPGRGLPGDEGTLSVDSPIFKPVEPTDFTFEPGRLPNSQILDGFTVQDEEFLIIAADVPLAHHPHYLVVSKKVRPQFLLPADLASTWALIEANQGWWATYSSVAAGAGVNHQHTHVIAGPDNLPWMVADRVLVAEDSHSRVRVEQLAQWPSDPVIVRGPRDTVHRAAAALTKLLQQNGIPHNLVLRPGEVAICPRSRRRSTSLPDKKFGTWETILGVCNASTEDYQRIDEPLFLRSLGEIRLDRTIAAALRRQMVGLVMRM